MKKFFAAFALTAGLCLMMGCADSSTDNAPAASGRAGGSMEGAGGAGPGYEGAGTGSGKYGTVPDGATNQALSQTNTALPGPTATPAVPTPAQPQ